jgi:hypothetical protein
LQGLPRGAAPSALAKKLADFHLLIYLATKFQDDDQFVGQCCGFVRTHVLTTESPPDGSSASAALSIDDDADGGAAMEVEGGRVGSGSKRRSAGGGKVSVFWTVAFGFGLSL